MKQVASEGCKELLFPLYPRVDNLFYDGLRKENLIECVCVVFFVVSVVPFFYKRREECFVERPSF